MDIKFIKACVVIVTLVLLLPHCNKKVNVGCPKEGYEYSNTSFLCWYSPILDSIRVGSSLILEASIPRAFIDENTRATVTNTSNIVSGPLGIGMIYPIYQAAVDSFELTAEIGKVIIQWDASPIDSFKIKISIKALAKGIYGIALKQQTGKDKDCALYKYFLKPGNLNQHLNYWMDTFGNVSDGVAFFTYCFKVY
jgi:hypothetical protein